VLDGVALSTVAFSGVDNGWKTPPTPEGQRFEVGPATAMFTNAHMLACMRAWVKDRNAPAKGETSILPCVLTVATT
jgi:hypothetical protein